jgi:hypothetical protein
VKKAFRESIDDYLEFCEERGEAPDRPFSGQFVTRIPPELHRQVNAAALLSGKSLNAWVAEQLQEAVLRIGAVKAATAKKPSAKTSTRKNKLVVRKAAARKAKREGHKN